MPSEVTSRFLILYGSQRGQAQSIAEEILEQAKEHGFVADISCLSQADKYNLEKETNPVVFVVSTTGDGEPPDTALKFVQKIKNKSLSRDHYAHLHYALLALGDTNYQNFCNGGKTIDRRLQELGAKRFYATGHADDGVGLEIVVEPWIEGLWEAIREALAEMAQSNQQGFASPESAQSSNVESAAQENAESTGLEVNLHLMKLRESDSQTSKQVASSASERAETELKAVGATTAPLEASLMRSLPPLSESALSVPALPPPYLNVCLVDAPVEQDSTSCIKEAFQEVPISKAVQLTRGDAVKTAILLELDISDQHFVYQPGDSFDVLCPNSPSEVEELLQRLKLTEQRNCCVELQLHKDTKKKAAQIPAYISEKSVLQHVLTWCLEIRSVPKKAFIRALVEHTEKGDEKRRLQELCSKQGSADYNRFVRDPNVCILDLLRAFPSCSPPLSLLIEHLPKLQPRSYSAASSSLYQPGKLHFVFNIVEFPACPEHPERRGLCTGWLADLVSPILQPYGKTQAPTESSAPLSLPKVNVRLRPGSSFRLPSDNSLPVVMVGPGTGVAPFIGFLQQREKELEENQEAAFGETWLFFGCRHKDREFLFREELERFVGKGILTHLKVCFSRDVSEESEPSPRYVQHNLLLHSKHIANILLKEKGYFYVCGDAKNMAKDVNDALVEIIGTELQMDKLESMKTVADLREEKRYLQDIWA
ncbi:methionine synthase reductase isoform X2 [Chanos chanos]|nr:methionine synthase reductase isoform X2 [Chanos chanos]